MKLLASIILFFISGLVYSQITFEPGYLIDNNDNRINCLIKNYDWLYSPDQIEYKLNSSSESDYASIKNTKEFGVSDLIYRRFTVEIDQSKSNIHELSKLSSPDFLTETVFLKKIITGKASLYKGPRDRFFFITIDSSNAIQLIHKEYLHDGDVSVNNHYISQIYNNLKCDHIARDEIKNIRYNEKDLVKIVTKYNKCHKSETITHDNTKNRKLTKLYLKPGFRISSFSLDYVEDSSPPIQFSTFISPSFSIEAEFILPFNKNKWAIIIEPNFQYYKATDPRERDNLNINYKSVELMTGICYYMFLTDKSKLFVTGSITVLDLSFNSTIGYNDIRSGYNFNFSSGYRLNDRYSAELRYSTRRELLVNSMYYATEFQAISIVLGFKLF